MKRSVLVLMICLLTQWSGAQDKSQNPHPNGRTSFNKDSISVLDFYRQFSSFTDPGEYEYLYKNLPDALPELCDLIRTQFIHPMAHLPRVRDQLPTERRHDESANYPSVSSILTGLVSYDSRGLIKNRKIENRLIAGCRQNAILLASILKYRGIPARVRAGHSTYLRPGFHLSHTICEVWNENDKRWMLVDPSTAMVDFDRDQFEFSNELWLKLQNGEIDLKKYGFPGRYSGLVSIVGKVSPDLASLLGNEYPVFRYAPMLDYVFEYDELTAEQIETLNKISKLMLTLDSDNISQLQEIYDQNPDIQITRSFDKGSNSTDIREKSINK